MGGGGGGWKEEGGWKEGHLTVFIDLFCEMFRKMAS